MKKLVLSAAILPVSLSAFAGTYQYEGNLGYTYTKQGDVNANVGTADATMYLNAVDDSKGPYAEAAFLNMASSVHLSYLNADGDRSRHGDAENVAADVTYVTPGEHYIGSLSFIDGESELGGAPKDFDFNGWGVKVGKYISDRMSMTLDYNHLDYDDADVKSDSLALNTRFVSFEGSAGESIALDASIGRTNGDSNKDLRAYWISNSTSASYDESYNTLALGTTFYATQQLGLSFRWDRLFGGYNKGDTMKFGAEYFFMPQLAASLTYAYADPDDSNSDSITSIGVGVTGRF